MTMGEKILNMRKARSWSQEDLAEHIGVSRQAVSRWEADAAKPDADRIIDLCDLFGVSADYLLRDLPLGACGGQGTAPEVSENTLKKAIRELPLRRWVGGILTLLCGVGLTVIQVMSAVHPCIYNEYRGLIAFLKTFGLEPLWLLLTVGLVVGIWKMMSSKPLGEYPFRAWGERVWRGICKLITR